MRTRSNNELNVPTPFLFRLRVEFPNPFPFNVAGAGSPRISGKFSWSI
jgi:hypothetical protein